MIITCGECNSSFVLDDSLIKVSGSKVRCSNCKHVFVVYPAAQEPDASVVEKPVAPQAEAKAPDVMPKAAKQTGVSAAIDDDPDLSKALDAINEDELDFSDDELGIETSAAPPVPETPPAAEPQPEPKPEPVAEEPQIADEEPKEPAETSAPSQEMDDIEVSLDEDEEDILDFADFELDMDESDIPSDVPELESGVTQELDLEFDEKMVMDDLLSEGDQESSEEDLDFSDLELELGGESEGSDADLTEDLQSRQAKESADDADTVMVDEGGLDFSDLDLDETADEVPAEDLDLSLDEESEAEPETMMIEEELDFSDLERELDGDSSDDMPASEDELDLDLDLDEDDISAEPETVLLEDEDLDFSEFELEPEGDKGGGKAAAEAKEESLDDELDFSDLAGILDSDEEPPDLPEGDEDVELELDLDSEDAGEAEATVSKGNDEEELDFSDLENLLDGMDDVEETKVEALPEDIDLELDGDMDEEAFELGEETPEDRTGSDEDDLDFSDVEAMLGSDDEDDEDLDLDLDLDGAEPDSGLDLEESDDEDLSLSLDNEEDSDIELELDLSDDQAEEEEEEFEDDEDMAIPALVSDEPDAKEDKKAEKKKAKKKPAPKRKAKGKGGGVVKKLIVALILILLVLFLLYMSKSKIEDMTDAVIPVKIPVLEDLRDTIGGMDIPFVSSWVKPSPKDPQGKLQLKTSGITGKIIVSDALGDLFVISGKVQNNYSSTRNSISLVGKLFGQGGKVVQSKMFYAGNVIPEEELVSMDENIIKNRLQNRLGDNGVNAKVRPGQIIPFMVVFTNLSENLTEFSVEAGGSYQGAAIK